MDRDESSSPRPHGDKGLQAAAAAARASSTSAQAVAAAAALNYSAFLNASVASHGDPSAMLTSTENLLRNIQGLLKVAAENARQQDRQANYEKGRCESQTMSACVCVRARVCVCVVVEDGGSLSPPLTHYGRLGGLSRRKRTPTKTDKTIDVQLSNRCGRQRQTPLGSIMQIKFIAHF